jgi:hypothetical protein
MDLAKATVENGYINVPVLISSTQDVNSLDFALQFNTSAMSFNTVVDKTNKLETLSNFNNDDQTLRFTSNSLTNYALNAQILNVKFAIGSHEVSANDFNAVAAYINGERVAFEIANGQISGAGAIVNVYPNPATDMINVVVSEDATVQLVDVSGRQVIYQTNVLLKVELHPIHSVKPMDAVKLQLNNILFKYHDHLHGIPLSYKHIKFPVGKEYARIFSDQSWLHIDVLTSFIVFTPVVGQVICGKINKVYIHICNYLCILIFQ